MQVATGSALSHDELLRYSRHLLLPEIGEAGQLRLRAARVALVGAGGLGSPAALYLAAAGVGTLGIIDFDRVDLTNLQRQILHGTRDLARTKLESAAARLGDLNPGVRVVPHETRLTAENALDILGAYDIVLDGSDNFPTRYLVNDACVLLGRPNVYGSIFRFEGQASLFHAEIGPCYRCLYPEPPPPGMVPSCAEGGVLGVLPGIIGSIQALEAIKWIVGAGESLAGRLVIFDALRLRFRELRLRKDPECPVCGTSPSIDRLIDYEAFCGADAVGGAPGAEVTAAALRDEVARGDALQLIDVREPFEWARDRIPGATHFPLHELPSRLSALDPHTPIVAYCERGMRSLQALELLRTAGFANVRSLMGGMHAWRTAGHEKDGR
ncbi:MAG: molybdopterin-synthase adenylyltransferase MoeB [Gemmatimonadales bacterium]|nr:molybdopterin-synthase adenylyltransferase MoeB [Gemmatimonadales bacterium]